MKKTIIVSSLLLLVSFLFGIHSAFAISRSLDIGSTGADVTELQTYLANSTTYYPSGLITGFYGPLTEAAIEKFQTAQSIVSSGSAATTGYGRVGPTTMARLNSLMGGNTVSMDQSPSLSATSVQHGSTNATLSWNTDKATQGQVYYNTVPLVFNEATGPRQQPYVSGAFSTDNGGQTIHSITIQNLTPNTTYYFLTRAVDSAGNMSMTWPSTFRTNQ